MNAGFSLHDTNHAHTGAKEHIDIAGTVNFCYYIADF